MESFPKTYIEGYHGVEAVKKMEYRILGNTGLEISKLSYGVSAVGSVFRETDDEESYNVIESAIKQGINWIDASPWYGFGKGEAVFGQAITKKKIPRNAYYLSTKVGRYDPDRLKMFDFSAERVTKSVDESLERLQVDYVDLIQVHDMEFAPSLDIIINETLPALQKIKDSGKARFIGITGFPLENFIEVIKRSTVQIDTIMSYCRYCLNDTGLTEILPFLKERGIGVFSASANGMGLLTHREPPQWHPSPITVKDACKKAVQYCEEQEVDITRLAINFTSNFPDIHTCMISTASMKNLGTNLQAANEPLTEHEQKTLEYIREKYLIPLNNMNWGLTDVEKHWKKVREAEAKLKS